MRVVVDSLLAPLNNWSDELIKFKVAAYPGRVYYGQIDKTKIDEVALDLFSLYGTTDVSDMEEKGIDFTRRLIERRLQEYCGLSFKAFIESDDAGIWRKYLCHAVKPANNRLSSFLSLRVPPNLPEANRH